MKKVQTVLALLLLAAITAVAQTPCAPHPTDPNAVCIGSYVATVDIAQSATVAGKTGKKGTKCTAAQLICVWRTSTGDIDLIGDPLTVKLTGTCLTDFPAQSLFAMLGQAAVKQAVALGHVQCSPTCDGATAARYLTITCVKKSGAGTLTKYDNCTTVQCVRAYTVCCPNGPSAPVINRAPAENVGCGDAPVDCQSACDDNCPPMPGVR